MYHFVPLIHPTKYIQSFHSAPHLRPPMCLQYAIWTVASNGHEKYGAYHDVFYQRARRYLEVDELKGFGEQFITVQHAQAWVLVTTDEARCLLFTRSGMGAARAMRLCEMLGLHRIDGERAPGDVPDVLPPAGSWIELEERRRTFWAAFCVDSHASVSTGWPNLIDSAAVSQFSMLSFILGSLRGYDWGAPKLIQVTLADYNPLTFLRGGLHHRQARGDGNVGQCAERWRILWLCVLDPDLRGL
jgi:hypothetical protein